GRVHGTDEGRSGVRGGPRGRLALGWECGMSAVTAPSRVAAPSRGRVTFPRVLRSEWIKLWSLRSTIYTMLGAVVALVALGLVLTGVTASRWSTMSLHDRQTLNSTALSIGGFWLTMYIVGVLGVLVIGGEYATGMIRASLSAVPKRLPVLWAKALVFS